MGRLEGKVSFISGAAGGMGQVACRMFCEEGSTVYGTDIAEETGRELEQQLRGKGHKFTFIPGDISTGAGVKAIADAVKAETDQLDVIYNNHGVCIGHPLLEVSEDEWDTVQNINLKSVFLTMSNLVPLMTEHGGSVVNVASVGGVSAFGAMAAYGAAKAGVIHLSKVAAVDLAPFGIRVNAVCPGVIDTPMPRNFIKDLANKDEVWEGFGKGHLVGRMGRPEEIVNFCLWLASDESTFMTGASLLIDGGWSVQ